MDLLPSIATPKCLKDYQEYVKENETSIRKARKLEATKKVMPLVTSRLSDLTAPLKIQGTKLILFEKVWLPLMVQIALRQGMDSDTLAPGDCDGKETGLVANPEVEPGRPGEVAEGIAAGCPFATPRNAQP